MIVNLLMVWYKNLGRYTDKVKRPGINWLICLFLLFLLYTMIAALDWISMAFRRLNIIMTPIFGIFIIFVFVVIVVVFDGYYFFTHRHLIDYRHNGGDCNVAD